MKNTTTVVCALFSLGSATLESQADFTPPGFLFRVFETVLLLAEKRATLEV